MTWVWFIGGIWLVVGLVLAVIIGRSIHLATLKAEHPEVDESPVSTLVPLPPPAPAVERRSAASHRQSRSTATAPRTPLIGGCVLPSARVPSDQEHGVL